MPDAEVRSALTDLQRQLKLGDHGRPTPPQNLHITMLFLGEVSSSEVPEIAEYVESIEVSPFVLPISKVGYWPQKHIVWAGPAETGPELGELSKRIRKALRKFAPDRRRFIPHITLARKVRRRVVSPIAPIEWQVRQIRLVRSNLTNEGAHYEMIAHSRTSA